jgi:hypothetical protein
MTIFLFYHDGVPWGNPKWVVNGKSVPLTEDEIKACQWLFMKVGPCMKHKISLSQVIDWDVVDTLPGPEKRKVLSTPGLKHTRSWVRSI